MRASLPFEARSLTCSGKAVLSRASHPGRRVTRPADKGSRDHRLQCIGQQLAGLRRIRQIANAFGEPQDLRSGHPVSANTKHLTPALPPSGQATLIVLMFIGRVGTITVATALALQRGRRPFRYAQERPIVG